MKTSGDAAYPKLLKKNELCPTSTEINVVSYNFTQWILLQEISKVMKELNLKFYSHNVR